MAYESKIKRVSAGQILPWLAAVGFLDALYLTIEHYRNVIPPCTIVTGCETVLTSQYASLFGIPTALFGVLYYLTIFALSLKMQKNSSLVPILRLVASAGLIVSGILIYIQAAILEAYCLFCLASALLTLLIFMASLRITRGAPGHPGHI